MATANESGRSGLVALLSADRVADYASGRRLLQGRRRDRSHRGLARLDGVALYPGMPAEVLIQTGERTLADYLLAPVLDSFARAFREE